MAQRRSTPLRTPKSNKIHVHIKNALLLGNTKLLDRYLRRGGEPECPDRHGMTLLMVAAFYNQRAMLEKLLEAGANIHATHDDLRTALHFALMDPETLPPLVRTPAGDVGYPKMPPETRDPGAMGEIARRLLEVGSSPDMALDPARITIRTRSRLKTPLQLAVLQKNTALVRLLLDYGATPDSTDLMGTTPLMEAAQYAYTDIVKALLEAEADPCVTRRDSKRALHLVMESLCTLTQDQRRHDERAKVTLNADQWALLTQKHSLTIDMLIAHGARPDISTLGGDTALKLAIRAGLPSIFELLLAHCKDLDQMRFSNEGTLHVLLEQRLPQETLVHMASLLLQAGADPQQTNKAGQSAVDIATDKGQTWFLSLLSH